MKITLFLLTKSHQKLQNPETSPMFCKILQKMNSGILQFATVQKCINPLDIEKCCTNCTIRVYVQKSASIQPRTSSDKFAVWHGRLGRTPHSVAMPSSTRRSSSSVATAFHFCIRRKCPQDLAKSRASTATTAYPSIARRTSRSFSWW